MYDPKNPWLVWTTTVAVLSVVAVGLCLTFDNTAAELYWREIGGKPGEQTFGFHLEYVPTPIPGREHMYVITDVTPGGRFARAGVQPGDTFPRWIGYAAHLGGFYTDLKARDRQPIRLQLVNVRFGGWWPAHVREVTVLPLEVPPN